MDTYQIAVRVILEDRASSALGQMVSRMNQAETAADKFKNKIEQLHGHLTKIRQMGAVGADMFREGVHFIHSMLEPARELNREMTKMNLAGLQHAEIQKNLATAWQSTNIAGATYAGSLERLGEFQAILGPSGGKLQEARDILEPALKAQFVLGSLTGDKDEAARQLQALVKISEMRGQLHSHQIVHNIEQGVKQAETSRGTVMPTDILGALKHARSTKMGLSDDVVFGGEFAEMIMEMKNGKGGGSSGVGVMYQAIARTLLQGQMSKKLATQLQGMGLLQGPMLPTTTTGTVAMKPGAVIDSANLMKDPSKWFMKHVKPLMGSDGNDPAAASLWVMQHFGGAGTFVAGVQELMNKDPAFARFNEARKRTGTLNQSYDKARQSADGAATDFDSAVNKLQIAFTNNVLPQLVPAINTLADCIKKAADFAKEHPRIGQTVMGLAIGITALGGALKLISIPAEGILTFVELGKGLKSVGILLSGGMGGGLIGLVDSLVAVAWPFLPWLAGAAIGIGAIVLLVKNWNGIMKFASDHIEGFSNMVANMNKLLAPAKGLLLACGDGLKGLFDVLMMHGPKPAASNAVLGGQKVSQSQAKLFEEIGRRRAEQMDNIPGMKQLKAAEAKRLAEYRQQIHAPVTINVSQQPGESAEQMAQRIRAEIEKSFRDFLASSYKGGGDTFSPFLAF